MESNCSMVIQVLQDEKVLKVGYASMSIYLTLLNYTLNNG